MPPSVLRSAGIGWYLVRGSAEVPLTQDAPMP